MAPQQVMVPLVRTAHEPEPPVDTALNPPAARGAVSVSGELASQRLTPAVVGKKRTLGSWRSPQVSSGWRCWSPNSMRPVSSLRATMRTSPTVSSSGELASQRSTVAVVGKKRTLGSWRSPQVSSGWRCWSPNSMRPVSSLRATMRTSVPSAVSWPATAEDTTAPPTTASSATATRQIRRALLVRRGVLLTVDAATVVGAGRFLTAVSVPRQAFPAGLLRQKLTGDVSASASTTREIGRTAFWQSQERRPRGPPALPPAGSASPRATPSTWTGRGRLAGRPAALAGCLARPVEQRPLTNRSRALNSGTAGWC